MRAERTPRRSNRKQASENQFADASSTRARIRPIVIYPFVQPLKLESLELLFATLKSWTAEEDFKPVVVINNQTRYRSTQPMVEDPRIDTAYKRTVDTIIAPVAEVIFRKIEIPRY